VDPKVFDLFVVQRFKYREPPEILDAKCQSCAAPPEVLENQCDARRLNSGLKLENFTHIINDISPLGFVADPAAVAGNAAPPKPLTPETESDPPSAALYAALPTRVPVVAPFETKSRQLVAPDVAKLEALLASNSNVGEEETAALTGTKFPEIPIASRNTPSNRRIVRDCMSKYYFKDLLKIRLSANDLFS
tara:strand:- start:69 stop:641 length:573 start_codon:yes stop_codon:yes gene_type:complete